jgi:mannose-6-phosphate isomerase-like protein (cupin superfamily)
MDRALFATDLGAQKGPFFRVLHTTKRSQTALMTVPSGADAGPPETHAHADQVFHVVEGEAEFHVWESDGPPTVHRGGPGTVVVVAAGIRHYVKSTGKVPLFFFTVYAPPEY